MSIIQRSPWTRQPQVPVALNPFWVQKGLVSASYFGRLVTKTAGPIGPGGCSVATGTDNTSAGVSTTANTFFCVANLTAVTADALAVGRLRYNASANFGSGLRFNAASLELSYGAGTSAWSYAYVTATITTGRNSYAGTHRVDSGHSGILLYKNGIALATPNTSGSNNGTTVVPFDSAINIGQSTASGATAVTAAIGGGIEVGATFASVLSEADIKSLHDNPWQILAPLQRRIWVPEDTVVTIARPGSDITTTGWHGTPDNVTKYANIDEASASDTDYITSPPVTGTVDPITFGIKDQTGNPNTLPVGTWDVTVRANYGEGLTASQVKVTLLDSGGASVGTSAWQAVTTSYADYTLSITTTGIAARIRIEVQ